MTSVLSSIDTGLISTKNTIRDQIPLLIAGSLTLVLTLQWNNVITAFVNEYIPTDESNTNMRQRVIYTLILTVIVFILITIVNGVASFLKTVV